MTSNEIPKLARDCGFELAGVASAEPVAELGSYHQWTAAGNAGEMRYLTDHRARVRDDPRNLLPTARSIICVGKLYHSAWPSSTEFNDAACAWISRYAWGDDYHHHVRRGLEHLETLLRDRSTEPFDSRICVDTAPLLERSYARLAGLGWIGRNTCLINQQSGSWFFLGELLTSLALTPAKPPPDRCGTCTRCIEACPTAAIVPGPLGYTLDSRLCIAYLTIELRGPIAEPGRPGIGPHIFGCDICQDVCPWNRRAPYTSDPAYQPQNYAPDLTRLAAITEPEFREMFRHTPISRARYSGFLRNVAVAMGNQRLPDFCAPLEKLASSPDPLVAEHARWALTQLP